MSSRFFLLGHQINHSLSPAIYAKWFRDFAIDAIYEPHDVAPESFAQFAQQLTNFAGGNITMPYKHQILAEVTALDSIAQAVGAVNIIRRLREGGLLGGNTDALALQSLLKGISGKTALVLGHGGAAEAAIYALGQQGWQNIQNVARSLKNWELREQLAAQADIIINATPLGGELFPEAVILNDSYSATHVIDLAYCHNLRTTPLLALAKQQNKQTYDGVIALIHQAAACMDFWFTISPDAEAIASMYRHLHAIRL